MLRTILKVTLLCSFLLSTNIFSQGVELEGTYKLVVRKLADGTRISSPDIIGLVTFSNNNRNFNVVYKNKDGKYFSYSLISKYQLTDKDYSETIIYSCLNDEIAGNGIKYQMEEESATVPITTSEGKIEVKLPFDPVKVTFYGDRFTAEGDQFTDYWEKVED